MRWSLGVAAAAIAAVMWIGCSDEPSGPAGQNPGPDLVSPDVILSDPSAPGSAAMAAANGINGAASVAFVSLAPGTVPEAEFVIIRNLTAGDAVGVVFPMVEGGLDPVAILAEADDRLELEFHDGSTVVARKYGKVPKSRPPSIVRVAPPDGRTDVALTVRPIVVCSEPVDPASIDGSVSLLRGGNPVAGEVVVPAAQPWAVEFVPDVPLEHGTAYEIRVATSLRDLDGEGLPSAVSSDFTTEPQDPPPPPPVNGRIAFVSTRSGSPWIYLANADGSGVVPLVEGGQPAWSRDGRMIAFVRGDELRVIGADGTGERLIVSPASSPAWSPDGERLAYSVGGSYPALAGIRTIRLDGTADELLLSTETVESHPEAHEQDCSSVDHPAWSPDGGSIAFDVYCWYYYVYDRYFDNAVREIWLVKTDGSGLRKFEGLRCVLLHPSGSACRIIPGYAYQPSWSPDGLYIAFRSDTWYDGSWHYLVSGRPTTSSLQSEAYVFLETPGNSRPRGVDWSPDGKYLAFDTGLVSQTGWRIHLAPRTPPHQATQLVPEVTGPGLAGPYDDYDIAWSRVSP